MPPTLRPSPSSISMTFRRQYVLPAPGRPVMPILSASPMPPTRRHKYALLYKNTLRIRRPESAPLERPTASGGTASSPARARNKGHKATRRWRLGSPLETRPPDRWDRDCDRRTPRRPLWHCGRQHGSDGIRLLLPGRTDAGAVLCEPPFERLELPRAHRRDVRAAGDLVLHRTERELGEPPFRGGPEDKQVVSLRLLHDHVHDVPDLHEFFLEGHAVRAAHLRKSRAVPAFLLQLQVRLDRAQDRDLGAVLLRQQDRVPGRVRHMPFRRVQDEDAIQFRLHSRGLEDDDIARRLLDEAVHVRSEDPALAPAALPSEDQQVRVAFPDVVDDG